VIEAFHNPLTNANGGGALRSVEPFTGLRITTTTGAGVVGDPVRAETWILDERGRLIAHDDPHAEVGDERWCEFRWTCPVCRSEYALADHPRREHGPQWCSGSGDGHEDVRMELVVTPLFAAPLPVLDGKEER